MWFLFCLRKREMIMENNFKKNLINKNFFFFFFFNEM